MVAIDTKKRDVQYLESPIEWQHYPMCPVKRTVEGGLECGIVLITGPTVYKANIYTVESYDDLMECEKEEFASVEELVAAGWQVD
jgi:hypothetical protein